MKLPISVSIIAHNEAHNIERCLKSVVDWVTEIIVVVNDCTDGTDTIARHYGASVYEHSWHGHRDQKNIALQYVKQPWVLALDCDEEVSIALKASILRFFQGGQSDLYQGAYFPRKVWFLGRWITHGDWYPDYSLRLFRSDVARWGGSTEHDKIMLQGPSKKLSGDLYHYSFPSLSKHQEKIDYFGDIFLKRLLERKAHFSAFITIVRAFWRFFRAYFIRLGFLDGFPGFYIAYCQAFATFYRYSKLYEYEHKDIHPHNH